MVRARSAVQSRALAQVKKEEIQKEISQIEKDMLQSDFWNNPDQAQQKIKKLQELKDELEGVGKYDKRNAVITIFSGAGGDDAEDWSRMLLEMYMNYATSKNYKVNFIDENQNPNGGYRSVTFEIEGKYAYANLKNESGVHRLVRISPFNANSKRQTSFSMVEVIPKMQKTDSDIQIPEEDLDTEYTKSSGPGGQNVNKRETAVRIVHKPTNISVLSSNQRSQAQNKDTALEILKGKLFALKQEQEQQQQAGLSISKTTSAEWGSQIRSYVLHPYQMVKDHRSNTETSDVKGVLNGKIDLFIESMR
jgi:peptide chain release factor 2